MKNSAILISILFLLCGSACQTGKSIVRDNVSIKLYLYEGNSRMKASVMPELKEESELVMFKRRFEYLLINVPEIHLPEKQERRNEISSLYPDTIKILKLYLKEYRQDKKLAAYFAETMDPITNPNKQITRQYTVEELMDIASKFFYCDKVQPDTSIQAHVCIGLNGIKEAKWEKDYTLLEAFCYEAIFNDLDKDSSQIWDSFVSKKKNSAEHFRQNLTSLNEYLEDVKLDVFEKMKQDETLKKALLEYYEANKSNLAFRVGS